MTQVLLSPPFVVAALWSIMGLFAMLVLGVLKAKDGVSDSAFYGLFAVVLVGAAIIFDHTSKDMKRYFPPPVAEAKQ